MIETKMIYNSTFLANLELFFLFSLQFQFPYSINSWFVFYSPKNKQENKKQKHNKTKWTDNLLSSSSISYCFIMNKQKISVAYSTKHSFLMCL